MPNSIQTQRVLFVCLGNICRSPTAHGIFQHKVTQAGLQNEIIVDSCGTGDWHIGHAPDPRTIECATKYGYDLSTLRARKLLASDFIDFDYILAMDKQNLRDAESICPDHFNGELTLFLDVLAESTPQDTDAPTIREVPDPYYGGADGFDEVIQLCEKASDAWLNRLRANR